MNKDSNALAGLYRLICEEKELGSTNFENGRDVLNLLHYLSGQIPGNAPFVSDMVDDSLEEEPETLDPSVVITHVINTLKDYIESYGVDGVDAGGMEGVGIAAKNLLKLFVDKIGPDNAFADML